MSERKRVQSVPQGKSLTHQNFAQETDINNMVSRHLKGAGKYGQPIGNPNASRQAMFGDFSNIDYHSMLNTVTQIDQMFGRLPARLRTRFRNRPELLLDFVSQPENIKEAVKLGLIADPEVIQEVLNAEQMDLEAQAKAAGEAPKPDPEAQPSYTPPKGGAK